MDVIDVGAVMDDMMSWMMSCMMSLVIFFFFPWTLFSFTRKENVICHGTSRETLRMASDNVMSLMLLMVSFVMSLMMSWMSRP